VRPAAEPPPPGHVLAAFGVAGCAPIPLGGGQGTAWRAGGRVLKPADVSRDELAWHAGVYPQITCEGFRLPRPLAAGDGRLCVDGWCATRYEAGRHGQRRWPEIIAAGDRFHAALRGIPRPPFLDTRSNPWSVSDRVAWGELPASDFPGVTHLPRLTAAIRPVPAPGQLIHGDLSGNVLFHDHLPPAIIDFTPYWRPAAYATAIVVADALVWEGADSQLLAVVSHIGDFGQYLIRALIFRELTHWICTRGQPPGTKAPDARWALAADLACRLAAQP
jgi:uncharacterized protein (TIGR02569 family)